MIHILWMMYLNWYFLYSSCCSSQLEGSKSVFDMVCKDFRAIINQAGLQDNIHKPIWGALSPNLIGLEWVIKLASFWKPSTVFCITAFQTELELKKYEYLHKKSEINFQKVSRMCQKFDFENLFGQLKKRRNSQRAEINGNCIQPVYRQLCYT